MLKNTIIRTYFYAKNEDYPDNNNITIYGKEVDEKYNSKNCCKNLKK